MYKCVLEKHIEKSVLEKHIENSEDMLRLIIFLTPFSYDGANPLWH